MEGEADVPKNCTFAISPFVYLPPCQTICTYYWLFCRIFSADSLSALCSRIFCSLRDSHSKRFVMARKKANGEIEPPRGCGLEPLPQINLKARAAAAVHARSAVGSNEG
jgi:hypothetical protein